MARRPTAECSDNANPGRRLSAASAVTIVDRQCGYIRSSESWYFRLLSPRASDAA